MLLMHPKYSQTKETALWKLETTAFKLHLENCTSTGSEKGRIKKQIMSSEQQEPKNANHVKQPTLELVFVTKNPAVERGRPFFVCFGASCSESHCCGSSDLKEAKVTALNSDSSMRPLYLASVFASFFLRPKGGMGGRERGGGER